MQRTPKTSIKRMLLGSKGTFLLQAADDADVCFVPFEFNMRTTPFQTSWYFFEGVLAFILEEQHPYGLASE